MAIISLLMAGIMRTTQFIIGEKSKTVFVIEYFGRIATCIANTFIREL
ncbi:MAG: hypothetical protein AAF392_02795 [Bacteroidota bacterium]